MALTANERKTMAHKTGSMEVMRFSAVVTLSVKVFMGDANATGSTPHPLRHLVKVHACKLPAAATDHPDACEDVFMKIQ
jgi:hypothetical protein